MQLGRVVGHATSTIKHPTLSGWRLLIVQMLSADDKPDGEPVLAIDRLGAAVGSKVIATSRIAMIKSLPRPASLVFTFSAWSK